MPGQAPTTSSPLAALVEEAAASLGAPDAGAGWTEPGSPVWRALLEVLEHPRVLPEAVSADDPPPGQVRTYLLHRHDRFVVFATVVGRRCVIPPHDHGIPGLVGLYRGKEEETRYARQPLEGSGGAVTLAEVATLAHDPGDIVPIRPPDLDVHQVANRHRAASVAVNVFAGDLLARGFRVYQPAYLATATGPLAYDQPPARG